MIPQYDKSLDIIVDMNERINTHKLANKLNFSDEIFNRILAGDYTVPISKYNYFLEYVKEYIDYINN